MSTENFEATEVYIRAILCTTQANTLKVTRVSLTRIPNVGRRSSTRMSLLGVFLEPTSKSNEDIEAPMGSPCSNEASFFISGSQNPFGAQHCINEPVHGTRLLPFLSQIELWQVRNSKEEAAN